MYTSKIKQTIKLNLQKTLLVVISYLVVSLFILITTTSTTYAVDGTSNKSAIQDELCGPASSSQNIPCRERVLSSLNQCDASHQPNNVGNMTWRECRNRVIATGQRPTSSSTGESTVTSATSGNFDGDCNERPLNRVNCGIVNFIWIVTDGLAVLVGIVVVMTLVIGGIEYSAAGNNPQAVVRAKKHISRALLALVAYFFVYAALQWLVPGGVF